MLVRPAHELSMENTYRVTGGWRREMSGNKFPFDDGEPPVTTTRRRLSAGLFGLPMLPLLPACGGVNGDSEGKAAGGEAVADAKTPDGSAGSAAGRGPASQGGAFRHPGVV